MVLSIRWRSAFQRTTLYKSPLNLEMLLMREILRKDKLIMLEVIGVVAAVISAIVAVLSYIHSIRKDRKQKKQPPLTKV